jgi:ACS family tartrate transporter-like MFS transporter
MLPGFIGTPLGGWLFGCLPHLAGDGVVAEFVNGLRDSSKHQFYFLQFMLGFFEGGFFPSVIVYLSLWFRPQDRAKAVAGFMSAIPVSIMIGSWISSLLLEVNWFGLPGWRWIFILEGGVPILAGIATLFLLPDQPTTAKWLPPVEREWLAAELATEAANKKGHGHWEWVHQLGLVLLLTLVYFGQNVVSYGLVTFMPAIIRSQSKLPDQLAGLVASLPFVMGLLGMLVNGWHSDRTGERFCHAAASMALLGLSVFAAALLDGVPVIPVLIMIFCVGPVMYAHLPAFWPIPTTVLGTTAAAAAIGFINMIGNLGGGFGRKLVSDLADQGSYAPALMRLAPWPIMSATIVLGLGWWRAKRKQTGG